MCISCVMQLQVYRSARVDATRLRAFFVFGLFAGLAAGMSAQEKAVKEQAMRDIKNKCIDAVVAFTLHMHAHSRDKSGKVELSSSKVRE